MAQHKVALSKGGTKCRRSENTDPQWVSLVVTVQDGLRFRSVCLVQEEGKEIGFIFYFHQRVKCSRWQPWQLQGESCGFCSRGTEFCHLEPELKGCSGHTGGQGWRVQHRQETRPWSAACLKGAPSASHRGVGGSQVTGP